MKIFRGLSDSYLNPKSLDIIKPKSNPFLQFIGIVILLAVIILIGSCIPGHADIVSIAQSQIGKGEIGGNNKGSEVRKYTKGLETAWCAAFVSWTIQKSGVHNKGYFLAAHSYWKNYPHVHTPRPGDLAVFSRGRQQGHIGIVVKVRADKIQTIEGNVGPYPSKVKRMTYSMAKPIPHLLGFVRI